MLSLATLSAVLADAAQAGYVQRASKLPGTYGAAHAWQARDASPTRRTPLLTKQPALCGAKNWGAGYLWLAKSHLECLGLPADGVCDGDKCGSLELNGKAYAITQINPHDGSDTCGSCQGCDTAFIALSESIDSSLHLNEGQNMSVTYVPASGLRVARSSLPDCPPLPVPAPIPGPDHPALVFEAGGLNVSLRGNSFAIQGLGYIDDTKYGKNFSFVPPLWGYKKIHRDMMGAHHVGDVTLRVQPLTETDPTNYAMYSSSRGGGIYANIPTPTPLPSGVVASHDITPSLLAPGQTDTRFPLGLNVTRSWETAEDGLVMRFKLVAGADGVRVGGFGMSLVPDATWGNEQLEQIGQSLSFLEPSIAQDHGFATWTRIDGSKTLVVTPLQGTRFEAYRPVLEDAAHVQAGTYEWTVLSAAWEAEWKENKQMPLLSFQGDTNIWKDPKGIWPSWSGNETFSSPPPQQWNPPTSIDLQPHESVEFGLKFTLAKAGPRTRDAVLESLGRAVMHAVPGYVVTPDMKSAKLFVKPPAGATVESISVEPTGVLAIGDIKPASGGYVAIPVSGVEDVFERCRVAISFSDNTEAAVHYFSIGRPLSEHVGNYSSFLANTAWLPVDYPDPFNRGASIAAWDRESKTHLLQDGRTFIVGLSDDAGGGNHLGFASKVGIGGTPTQEEVSRIDDYIRYTLYGPKPEAYPWLADPHFQLQEAANDRILMTVFYYHYTSDNHKALQWKDWEGKDYYTELNKCNTAPSWCGFNSVNNETAHDWHPADYRAFNSPHQAASYLAMYTVARNYPGMKTLQGWQWYLERAANTTIGMGAPSTGLMDGTVFREILIALKRESFEHLAGKVEENMKTRVDIWNNLEFPYGSEFNWDTTGQEETAIWGAYFDASHEIYGSLNDRVVDAILAFQPSTWNWAWHGSAEGWGDFSNNAKWMITGGWEREGGHYRAGLNSVPLGESFRRNPDELYLLEVAMGGMTGPMTNIDSDGAPSMGFHLHPFVLQHDPNSGDYGLAFFGATMNHGSYLVRSEQLGYLCYLCNVDAEGVDSQVPPLAASGTITLEPRDAYHRRVYLEPLGLELRAVAGSVASAVLDLGRRRITVRFAADDAAAAASAFRLEVSPLGAASRDTSNFRVTAPAACVLERGAYTVPKATGVTEVVIEYDAVQEVAYV